MNMHQNRKIILSLIIGIIFSGVTLYFSFKNVPLKQLLHYIGTIDVAWIVISILIGLSSYVIRVLRWQMILRPVKKIGFIHTYHPLVIAFMLNCILPGRVGELARPAILYKRDNVPFSKGIATVGVERVFDLLTLLIFFTAVMSTIEIDSSITLEFNGYPINKAMLQSLWVGMLKAGILLMSLIFMLMIPAARNFISRTISWIPRIFFFTSAHFRENFSRHLLDRSRHILDNLAMGFEVMKNPAKIISCLLLSLLIWLLVYLAFYVLTLGSEGVHITFHQASAVMIIVCLFIILPSVPGFWGIWEIGGIYGLMLFGVPKVQAAGVTLAFHAAQIFPVILLGLFSAWVTGVNIIQAGLHAQDDGKEKS